MLWGQKRLGGMQMRIIGLTEKELLFACRRAGKKYNDNLDLADVSSSRNKRGDHFTFRLRVKDSSGPGAQFSPETMFGGGRKTVQACWHAHRDFFYAVFKINPKAVVHTALATYRGVDDFQEKFMDTAYLKLHSKWEAIAERCRCS